MTTLRTVLRVEDSAADAEMTIDALIRARLANPVDGEQLFDAFKALGRNESGIVTTWEKD